jgi:hypothetical protein
MSTTYEVSFDPLALDGSNYSSWHSNVLISLKVLGPIAEGIMVASILPKDETCVSPKEMEKQLNVIITNLLCSCVCRELKYLILKRKRIGEYAHLIWKLLLELVHTKWDEIESDDEDEPAEMCSTTSTTSTDHQASTLKQGEDQGSEDVVPLQGPVRPVTHTGQTGASRGTPTCLMAKKEKKSKKKRQAKGAKSQKIEASSSPTRELELLKSELASLDCKYELLANKYDHDIKSFAYRTKVEEEANDELEAQLEKLTLYKPITRD